jgi:hypothetical protein
MTDTVLTIEELTKMLNEAEEREAKVPFLTSSHTSSSSLLSLCEDKIRDLID